MKERVITIKKRAAITILAVLAVFIFEFQIFVKSTFLFSYVKNKEYFCGGPEVRINICREQINILK
jgi:hypothetical protein